MIDIQILTPGLRAKFDQFANKVQRQMSLNALRAGARIFRNAAKKNAPVKSGALRDAIVVRTRRYNAQKQTQSVTTGVSKREFTGKEFYAAFVEFGHRKGKRMKKGMTDTRKFQPGEHYLEYAFDEKKAEATRVTQDKLVDQINSRSADVP